MSAYKSDFLRVLAERGFIHQVSDAEGLDAKAAAGPLTAYVGFDATAPSLHIGNLLTIMMLRWLQKTGHRPIALMGGGTSKIGDPSGKDASRTLLTGAQIEANIASIRTVFSRFLDFDAGAMMADNAEWLDRLHYIPFLRDVGRHFTINKMLTFDSVKLRLEREQPLTFLEFNYMILQAYDFVELYKRHGCILQMGGSDQWGNIVNGIDLGRRLLNAGLFALTTPLLTTSSGSKMGKTETGAVWLNADMTSSYKYWQFWRNCEDADVIRLLKLFTDLPLEEIEPLARLKGEELNDAKKILADKATELLHGPAAAEQAAKTARQTFEEGGLGEQLPTVEISPTQIGAGFGVAAANTSLGFTRSNAEARQLIRDGAIRLGNRLIADPNDRIRPDDFDQEGRALLRTGRKKRGILTIRIKIDDSFAANVSDSGVGFLKLENNDQHATPAGTGIFARLGKISGVITAGHVIKHLSKAKVGLVRFSSIEPARQNFKLDMKHTDPVMIWNGKEGDAPDLGFVRIPDFDAKILEAEGSVFYNLERARNFGTTNPNHLKSKAYAIVGAVAEWAEEVPGQQPKTKKKIVGGLFGAAKIIREYIENSTDLIEAEIDYSSSSKIPASYEGLSGSPLWELHVELDGEKIVSVNKKLHGIAFRQSDDHRLIVCTGASSIEHLVNVIMAKWPDNK
jgi:tyrosyl-tRNA synthetase